MCPAVSQTCMFAQHGMIAMQSTCSMMMKSRRLSSCCSCRYERTDAWMWHAELCSTDHSVRHRSSEGRRTPETACAAPAHLTRPQPLQDTPKSLPVRTHGPATFGLQTRIARSRLSNCSSQRSCYRGPKRRQHTGLMTYSRISTIPSPTVDDMARKCLLPTRLRLQQRASMVL